MSARDGLSTYFGHLYEGWRPDRQAETQNRRQRRSERRAVRAQALAYKREQADLANAHRAKVAAAENAEKIARDQRRGYAVDFKRVVMAYGVEAVVASASAYGQYLLALQYGSDWLTTQEMVLAPIAYATVELCRVPLALSVRAHRQWPICLAAFVGVIGAAGITVKSMSQLGNMMFSPRLTEVVTAREKLDLAQATDDQLSQHIAVADTLVNQRRDEQRLAVDNEKAAGSDLAGLPTLPCHPVSWYDRRAKTVIKTTVCAPDTRSAALTSNLSATRSDAKTAQDAYEWALKERNKLDRGAADRTLADARAAYREAVRKSQLHDFASMVWGISPSEVTDGMVAQFLRWFVFGSAVCVAFASTLIAFTAITRVKPAKPSTIMVHNRNGEFILGPFAEKVIAEAKAAVNVEADSKIARARQEADNGNS
jgi:hypothetical protein